MTALHKNTGTGCLMLIIILVIATIALTILSADNPHASVNAICAYVTDTTGAGCDANRVMRDYPMQVDSCQQMFGNARESTYFAWLNCLEERGVDLLD